MAGVEAVRVLSVLDETVEGMQCVSRLRVILWARTYRSPTLHCVPVQRCAPVPFRTEFVICGRKHLLQAPRRSGWCRLLSYVTPSVLRAPEQIEALLGKVRIVTVPDTWSLVPTSVSTALARVAVLHRQRG